MIDCKNGQQNPTKIVRKFKAVKAGVNVGRGAAVQSRQFILLALLCVQK